ncbi:start domain protein, partial [Cystoisospora suis]
MATLPTSVADGIAVAPTGGHRLPVFLHFPRIRRVGPTLFITLLHIFFVCSVSCHVTGSLPATVVPETYGHPAPSSTDGPRKTSASTPSSSGGLLAREEPSKLRRSQDLAPGAIGADAETGQTKQIPRVPDAQLDQFLNFAVDIREGNTSPEWELLLQGPPVTVWRRLIPGTNVHDYVATGGFSDISAVAYNTTFNNLPFRACWDDSVVEIRTVEVDRIPRVSSSNDECLTLPPSSAGEGERVQTFKNDAVTKTSPERVRSTKEHDAGDVPRCPPSLSCMSHSTPETPAPRPSTASPGNLSRGDKKGGDEDEKQERHPVNVQPGETREGAPDESDVEEVIYWRVKLPWPLQDRDFVYARRFRLYPEKRAIVSVQQATESPYCPEFPQAVRVDKYNSTVVLFADNAEKDLQKKGVVYVVYHFDASKTPVPPWVKSYFTTNTLPRTIAALHTTAKKMVRDDGTVRPQFSREVQQTLKYHDDAHELLRRQEFSTGPNSSMHVEVQASNRTQARDPSVVGTAKDGDDMQKREVDLQTESRLAGEIGRHPHVSKLPVRGNTESIAEAGRTPSKQGKDATSSAGNTAIADEHARDSPSIGCRHGAVGSGGRRCWTADEVGCSDYDERTLMEAYQELQCGASPAEILCSTEGGGHTTKSWSFCERLKERALATLERLRYPWHRGRNSPAYAAILCPRNQVICPRSGRQHPAFCDASRSTQQYCLCRPGVFKAPPMRRGQQSFTHASDMLAYVPLASGAVRALEAVLQIQEQAEKHGSVSGIRSVAVWPWWGCRNKLHKDARTGLSQRSESGREGGGGECSSNDVALTK